MKRILTPLASALIASTALSGPVFAQDSGFVIRLNGDTVSGDPRIAPSSTAADRALEKADVQIQYNGLDVTPRLDLEIEGTRGALRAGQSVTLQSALNYPAFVRKGDVRLIDLGARGGARVLGTYAIDPNGKVTVTVPEGENIVAVHRVYDESGRFDETAPLPLMVNPDRGLEDGVEDGNDSTTRRGISVFGGAVVVSGSSVPQGAQVQTLGETVRPGRGGDFVIERILPPGEYAVGVQVTGAGQSLDLVRDVDVPRSELFYVGHGELTFGWRDSDLDGDDTYVEGRFAGYFKGRYASGLEVTAQLDTGEGEIREIFRSLDEQDPRSTILRVDPDDLYPTYGDDSTLVDDTPSSGKFYLRLEKNNNYAIWGDWRASLDGSKYLRNDRTLYGARVHLESAETTRRGHAVQSLDAYAAQPDRIPQRDVFRGTGGSVYFLSRQDIGINTETLFVQVRDATTGRVLETRRLVAGRDYQINYIQGIITLSGPLQSATGSNGIVITDPGGAADVNLVVQYEFTPTTEDVDAFAYGLRAERWVTDQLRLGVTGLSQETNGATQKAYGIDVLYSVSDDTFVQLDYAKSDGPGFGSTLSTDGGLVFDPVAAAGGTGDGVSIEARASFADLGLASDGAISAYFEERSDGFSTLDYTATGDETLYGFAVDAQVTDRLSLGVYYDSYEQDGGRTDKEGGLTAEYQINETMVLGFGLETLERQGVSGSGDGSRTDAALRLTMTPRENLSWYVYGQTTLERSGTLEENDRFGIGTSISWANGWSAEFELSDGDQGAGGRLLLRSDRGEAGNTYFGYELDPTNEIVGVPLAQTGRAQGRYIVGGERAINEQLTMFGENRFDTFDRYNTLTSAYGVTYSPNEVLSYTTAIEYGRVRDEINGDFDRRALSFGVRYADDTLTASGRIEYRDEDGTISASTRDSQTWLLNAAASYQIDDDQRLVFGAKVSRTNGNSGLAPDSDYTDVSFGYALRPVQNERLNLLLRYRYLNDAYGQQLDNSNTPGPVQRSHVFSVDATYDLNENWTLGGKLGVRLSESAPDSSSVYTSNDAMLAVLNARWHVLHNWDALVEVRALDLKDAGTTEIGALGAIYRHINKNVKVGVGYNFTSFSDDLTDLTNDDEGLFINIIAKF